VKSLRSKAVAIKRRRSGTTTSALTAPGVAWTAGFLGFAAFGGSVRCHSRLLQLAALSLSSRLGLQ
jgi:hypothetical protein